MLPTSVAVAVLVSEVLGRLDVMIVAIPVIDIVTNQGIGEFDAMVVAVELLDGWLLGKAGGSSAATSV